MARGLEMLQMSTLLGPSHRGRRCHGECHDPSLNTAGQKTPFHGTRVMIKEKQPWHSDQSGYGCRLHIIYADADLY